MRISLIWNRNSREFQSYNDIRKFLEENDFAIYKFSDSRVVVHTVCETTFFSRLILPAEYVYNYTFRLLDLYPNRLTAFLYTPLKLVFKCPHILDSLVPPTVQETGSSQQDESIPNTKPSIIVYQDNVPYGPFSLLQLREFDMRGFICHEDYIVFEGNSNPFRRRELYSMQNNSAFGYFPLILRCKHSDSVTLSMQYPITIGQDCYWYGPFSVQMASDLYTQKFIHPKWNSIVTYPESIPKQQLPAEFERFLLIHQPGAFQKQKENVRNNNLLLESSMGSGCKRRPLPIVNRTRSRFASLANAVIGELTGRFLFLDLNDTSTADSDKSLQTDCSESNATSSLSIQKEQQLNDRLCSSDNLPCSSPTVPLNDPTIQRQHIQKLAQAMESSTTANGKLDFDRNPHHILDPQKNYLLPARVDRTPSPPSVRPSVGTSTTESYSPKSIISLRDSVVELGSFCFSDSSLEHDSAAQDTSSSAKIYFEQQQIDLSSRQSTSSNHYFPHTNASCSVLEPSIHLSKRICQRPVPCPASSEDSTSTYGLKSGVKYELAALEKWIQYYDEFPPNTHQLLQDRGICSLRQLYVQSAAVESLAESFKPIKKKQFMQVYSAFKSAMAVVFDPSSVHQLLQPVNGILKQHNNRIRKKKLVEFLCTVGSKFMDWEDDSKEDSGAVLEATEECASVAELKQQLESENTALEFINDLLFSDDDDDDDDGGGAVDEARSSNTGINERNPEASSNPPIASFSHGVAGTKELSKRARKKNGKGNSNEKQVASVPSSTSCAFQAGMNGGAGITVGFGKPKLTKGAQHALQRAKESHQQRARRLKSMIDLLSLENTSSVHATQYNTMVKGEAVINSVCRKKISWKST